MLYETYICLLCRFLGSEYMGGHAKGNQAQWKGLVELHEMNVLDVNNIPHTTTVLAT